MQPLTIGVNALYLLPGGVGGTEIYLRGLLAGLAEIDPGNRYVIFTNRSKRCAPGRGRGGLSGSKPCWRWKRRGAAWT